MTGEISSAAQRLANWIRYDAVPLWSSRGISPKTNASFERLTAEGVPDVNCSIRVRVQARQAYFFSVAYTRGWCPDGLDIATKLLNFSKESASLYRQNKGYAHLLSKDFVVTDWREDLYDHAFFLLANAWCYRASGTSEFLIEAERILIHIDTCYGVSSGGWKEGNYDYICRRQNPHMHIFEAYLALYEATKDPKWMRRAEEIFILFKTKFFDSKRGVLFEFFDDDWNRMDTLKGLSVEPGHMMEWVWLLDWYARYSGDSVSQYTEVLYKRGLDIGMDSAGLLYNVVTPDGKIIDADKRCWCITELIKASLVQLRAGDKSAEGVASKAVENLFNYFLCSSTKGSYIDQRGHDNQIVTDHAPASTLYHLVTASVELLNHFEHVKGEA